MSEATVGQRCGSCETQATCRVWEAIVGLRLQWAIWCECATCGPAEEFGWDETPPEARQALLEQCGVFRLRTRPGARFSRVRLMRALRESGMSLADVSSAVDRLQAEGVTGTETEMRLLELKLQYAGAETAVVKDDSASANGTPLELRQPPESPPAGPSGVTG